METLKIRKFAYLRTPLYSWAICNEQGGSFSNSGMHKSRVSVMRQIEAQYPGNQFKVVDIIENGEEDTEGGK